VEKILPFETISEVFHTKANFANKGNDNPTEAKSSSQCGKEVEENSDDVEDAPPKNITNSIEMVYKTTGEFHGDKARK